MTDTPTMEECIMSTITEGAKQRAEAVRVAEEALDLGVPLKIWVLTVDGKHEMTSHVFREETEMQAFVRECMEERWADVIFDDEKANYDPETGVYEGGEIEMPEDFDEMFSIWGDYETDTSFKWDWEIIKIYPSDLVKP